MNLNLVASVMVENIDRVKDIVATLQSSSIAPEKSLSPLDIQKALTIATIKNRLDIIKLIAPHCDCNQAPFVALVKAAEYDYLDIVQFLLPFSDVDSCEEALKKSIEKNHVGIVECLAPVCSSSVVNELWCGIISSKKNDLARVLFPFCEPSQDYFWPLYLACLSRNDEYRDFLIPLSDVSIVTQRALDENCAFVFEMLQDRLDESVFCHRWKQLDKWDYPNDRRQKELPNAFRRAQAIEMSRKLNSEIKDLHSSAAHSHLKPRL